MNFTKKLFFSLVLLLSVGQLFAQLQFSISEPAGIAGEYDVAISSFGSTVCDLDAPIEAPLVFVTDISAPESDGCDSITQDLTGKIAFVDRGICFFTKKVLNCQKKGAMAVVICNNVDKDIVNPLGSDPDVNILSCMISKSDCAKIRLLIDGSVGKLNNKYSKTREETRTVIWEEDFNDGMDGWETTQTGNTEGDTFLWDANGNFPNATAIGMDGSTCTGAVGVPGTWYQSERGTKDFPPEPELYKDLDIELISPSIDLSAVNMPLAVEFDQTIQVLNPNSGSYVSFSYSIDGGENWITQTLFDDLAANDPAVTSTERIPLVGAEGNANVKLRFHYTMDFYSWIIDNVKILEREANNIGISSFYAIPPDAQIPLSQVYPIHFLAELENIGANAQHNVKMSVSIKKDGQEIFTAVNDYGTVDPDTSIFNQPFTDTFTPSELGVYTGSYSIVSDEEDFDPTNNVTPEFTFEVTDATFAKETEATTSSTAANSNWTDSENTPHSWAMGNVYVINNNESNGKLLILDNVEIAFGNPDSLIGNDVVLFLYKWDDSANNNGIMEEGEFTSVGFAEYTFTGDETAFEPFAITLDDDEDDGNDVVNLEANTTYVVMMQYTDPTTGVDKDNLYLASGSGYDRFAQSVLNAAENTEIGTNLFGLGIGDTRIPYVYGVLPDENTAFSEISYRPNRFGTDFSPVIRMNLKEWTVATDDVLSSNNIIKVFPNPTQNEINVSLDLAKAASTATINITDITGKVVMTKELSNVKEGTFKMNTTTLPNGVYNLNVITDEGFRASKFVIQK